MISQSVINTPIGTLLATTCDGTLRGLNVVESFENSSPLDVALEKEIEEYFLQKRKAFSFQIELSGTLFQQEVYNALLKVPYGERVSYKELAKLAGYPKAYRAVGSALNKNPMILVIPCHRVVGQKGDLGGFKWGAEMKKKLLDLESSISF